MSEIEWNRSLTTTKLSWTEVWQIGNWKTTPTQTGIGGVLTQKGIAPHPHGSKLRRDISGARSPRPTSGPPSHHFSARKVSSRNDWLRKSVRTESVEETAGAPGSSSWEPTHGLTYSDSLTLSSSTKVEVWRAPVLCREKLMCLALCWALPNRASRLLTFLRLHQSG